MSYIQDIACEALKAAHADIVKARRLLLMAAGLLALIHLLTVHPYLKTSGEISDLEKSIAANSGLLSSVAPEIKRLQMAEKISGEQLDKLLDQVTDEMIRQFDDLRPMVQHALRGELLDIEPPPDIASQLKEKAMSQQMVQSTANQAFSQTAIPEPRDIPQSNVFINELLPILQAISADTPDASSRMIAFVRRHIVGDTYGRAQAVWSRDIRPTYLSALQATEKGARLAAKDVPQSATEIAAALSAAAAELARQRAAVEAIKISHDNTVDEALDSDWWRTVEGKIRYADAVKSSIGNQMSKITKTATSPSTAIRKILGLQQELKISLEAEREQLKKQFVEQRKQLASLSGSASLVPVDFISFIGLFPLVLGVVLSLLLHRAGQARRDAALAASGLALAAPEDMEPRAWLIRRVLGGDSAVNPLLVTVALAVVAVLWITLAALQVADSPMTPPLTPWAGAALSALMVFGAAIWDAASIRRLAAELPR